MNQYKYTDKEQEELLKSIVIIIDKREKVCDHITSYYDKKNIKYIRQSLPQGDYSFYIPKNEELSIHRDIYFNNEICIERKASLEELSGNFSQERDRFEKEISLYKGNMTLLIESANYHDICTNNYNTQYNKKSFLGTLHSFSNRYNFNFIFIPNNEYTPIFIYFHFYYYLKNILK